MSVRLFIRIPTAELQPELWQTVEWAIYRPNGERIAAGTGTPAEVDGLLQQNGLRDVELTLLVPSQTVLSSHARIPARQARYIQQALPYAVEENIAQDIDSMHLAAARKADKGVYNVLAVSRSHMDAWLSFAQSLGYSLTGIYPDAMALPYEANQWSLCLDDGQALMRYGVNDCVKLAKFNLLPYLDLKSQSFEEASEPLGLRVFVTEAQGEENAVLLAQLQQIPNLKVTQERIGISPFELLCESLQRQSGLINLCQGAYAVKSERKSQLQRWAPVLWIAATWFVIQVGIHLGTGFYYQKKADEFYEQARSLYLDIFPNERRVTDIRRSLEGKLRAAQTNGGGTSFLGLLSDAGYQLMQQPNRQAFTLRSLNYNRQRGELSMELQAGSLEQLDQYKQAMATVGYNVEIGSAIREQNTVRSRIIIRAGS